MQLCSEAEKGEMLKCFRGGNLVINTCSRALNALFSDFALDRGANIFAGSGWRVSRAHASPQDGGVLPTLPAARCLVTKRGVGCGEAGLEEQVIWSLVTKSVGMLAPRPQVRVFNWLGGQLGLENLRTREHHSKKAQLGGTT